LSQFGIFIGAIPLISLTYGIFRNAYRFQLRQSKIKIDQIPSELIGLKIIQISDIHSGSFLYPEEVNKAVEIINNQSADLVFFTGDLVNNTADEVIPLLPVLSKIKAKYGVYSILGNHDYGDYVRWENSDKKQENLDRLKLYHKELGWQLLTNENRIVNINGKEIGIIGVENFSTHMRFPKYGKLKESFSGVENTSLKLLLSHDPSHWAHEVITEFKDIAITFSGHTHGFQFGVEIPGIIQWSPIQYVYKQWAGLYKKGNQMLYVNRGLGHLGYPGRVGILPEVTLIEIV
jgi:predicted MPP superfamily phosphohydrolase